MADPKSQGLRLRYRKGDTDPVRIEYAESVDPFDVLARVEREFGKEPGLPCKRFDAIMLERQNKPIHSATAKRSESEAGSSRTPEHRKQKRGDPSDTPFDAPAQALPPPPESKAPATVADSLFSAPSPAAASPSPRSPVARDTREGVRDTSMLAYRSLEWSGKLSDQQRVVLGAIVSGKRPDWTRKELEAFTEIPINAICGRVHELMTEPFALLEELEPRKCSITGNTARPVRVAREDVVLQLKGEAP